MSLTLQEMAVEICTEVGGDTSDTTLLTKIVSFIKSALRKFPLYTRNKYIVDVKTGTLSSGNYSMSIPSGLIEPRDVYYVSGENRMIIERRSYGEFNREFQPSGSGAPETYRIVGDTVEFNHAAAQDYTIYFEGKCSSVDALTSGTTFTGSDEIVEVAKDGAKAIYYLTYTEDAQIGMVFEAKFKDGLNTLDGQYMVQDLSSHVGES